MFIYLLLCIVLNYIAAKRVKKIAENRLDYPYKPLPDIVHDCEYLPEINTHIPDYILGITGVITIIKYIYLPSDVYLNFQTLIYSLLLRSISTSLTVIPTCLSRPVSKNIYSELFTSTHDLIFSGHTIVFIFLGRILNEGTENIYLYILSLLVQICLPFTLILARQHYSFDVLYSMIVYNFFYLYLNN